MSVVGSNRLVSTIGLDRSFRSSVMGLGLPFSIVGLSLSVLTDGPELSCLDHRPRLTRCGLRLDCFVYRSGLARLFHHPYWAFLGCVSKLFQFVLAIGPRWVVSAFGRVVWLDSVVLSRPLVWFGPRWFTPSLTQTQNIILRISYRILVGQIHVNPNPNPFERGLWGSGAFFWPPYLGSPLKGGLTRSGLGLAHGFIGQIDTSTYYKVPC